MSNFESDIKKCCEVLSKGGSILYPTDTIWGIGCDATNAEAIEKVYAIKQRPKNKSFIVLLAEAKDILTYVANPHPDIISIVENFDRPTTVIYNNAVDLPDSLVHETGTIAIRVTTDTFCKALIKRFGKPIVSTSANISSESSPASFHDINNVIKEEVDYVVGYRQDDTSEATASQIIRINDDDTIQVIRS